MSSWVTISSSDLGVDWLRLARLLDSLVHFALNLVVLLKLEVLLAVHLTRTSTHMTQWRLLLSWKSIIFWLYVNEFTWGLLLFCASSSFLAANLRGFTAWWSIPKVMQRGLIVLHLCAGPWSTSTSGFRCLIAKEHHEGLSIPRNARLLLSLDLLFWVARACLTTQLLRVPSTQLVQLQLWNSTVYVLRWGAVSHYCCHGIEAVLESRKTAWAPVHSSTSTAIGPWAIPAWVLPWMT
jgi:hypothetical protein